MTAPVYIGAGTVVGGTGALGSVGFPTGILPGDIIMLAVETANESISTPADWTEVTDSPQGTGAGGGTSSTRLTLFWQRYAEGGATTVAVSDSGNHQLAQTFAFRGCLASGDPWDILVSGVDSTEDTSVSATGGTTTVDDCLVAVFCARSADAGADQFSSWANADLAGFTERTDFGTTQGNGGGHSLATGVKTTAGAFGASTATLANASVKAFIVVALEPSPAPWVKALGAGAGQAANLTLVWPTHVAGDVALAFIETANQPVAAPDGWAEVTNSPQGTGTAGTTTATACQVFWRRAASAAESDAVFADAGDHQIGRIITFANCASTGDPWDVTLGEVKAVASTAVSVSGPTTTVDNTLCVVVVSTGLDANNFGSEFSSWANANLVGFTEMSVYIVSTPGNGGGHGIAVGVKATAGAVGTTTATLTNSFANAQMVIALKAVAAAAAVGRSWGYVLG